MLILRILFVVALVAVIFFSTRFVALKVKYAQKANRHTHFFDAVAQFTLFFNISYNPLYVKCDDEVYKE